MVKSIICAEQIRTIDQQRLLEYCGNVGDDTMSRVDCAIAVSMGIKNKENEGAADIAVSKEIPSKMEDEDLNGSVCKTELDGGQHDWNKMIMEQIKFYSNVSQYLKNLRINKRMIDDEIQTILECIIETRFDAAKGFRVYQILREKKKLSSKYEREIQELEIITKNFPVQEMIDASKRSQSMVNDLIQKEKRADIIVRLLQIAS